MNSILMEVKFDEKGLIPVVTKDVNSGEVLMLAYMNREALKKTLETGRVHYWSRSRNKLWLKGETSGNYQLVKSIRVDCDGDALLIMVEQKGVACHTGHYSCFYRELDGEGIKEVEDNISGELVESKDKSAILRELYDVIVDRKKHPKEGSYTNYLFEKGLDKILKKVGEESAEVIIAAKNKSFEEIRYEIADLLYHLFVLMVERGLKPDDIYDELRKRR
ncbi:MAG TPA: bifunctional phosphoribosyl-AMP cyclohydrolase/phosphoribosyl-ATP diphosphatase HisIE [Clostridiaceae bacterium]|nr:bifunctional phosphoribosyl-AMP cyclohydrolase/phosphoribosyl-ATP diphosphatase HisIE [Clostridiaceae bacterium]